MAESAALLVDEVLPQEPIRQWVLSFPFQPLFLFASNPKIMGEVLGIVYRIIATHLIKKARFTKKNARTGAVTLIQRFGSALNLNVHYHMLFLDGVYTDNAYGKIRFHRVKAPCVDELSTLVNTISHRVARFFERKGLLERDAENTYLQLDHMDDDPTQQLHGHSIIYRVAAGAQRGARCLRYQPSPQNANKESRNKTA